MEEKRDRALSLLFGKINLYLTSLLFLFVAGWLTFSLIMDRMDVAKREFRLLQTSYLIIGIYLLIPIIIGTSIGFFEFIFKKKEAAKKGFYINLALLTFWTLFLIWSFML